MNNIFKIDIDTSRIFGLDILRAFAILFVLIEHGSSLLPKGLSQINDCFVFDGVSIFFVLSGFLIGGILIKLIEKNGFSPSILKKFWIRRWYRTLPNYFLILITLCILNLLFNYDFSLENAFRYFIFSQNLSRPHPDFFPEAWSLSVEEWFYLLFPLLLCIYFLFTKFYKGHFLFVTLVVIIVITSFRFYRFSNVSIDELHVWDLIFRKQVITRLDSLMFGVLGAYTSHCYPSLWTKFKDQLMWTGIFIFMASKFLFPYFIKVNSMYFCVFSFTLTSIGTLFLLPYLSELKTGNGFLYKPITYMSLVSYSMYLLNLSIVRMWIIEKIPWQEITDNSYIVAVSNYSIYWLLIVGLSILLYKYFEIPMTSLRERF